MGIDCCLWTMPYCLACSFCCVSFDFIGILKVDMKQFIESLKEEGISKDLIDKDTAIEMLETI